MVEFPALKHLAPCVVVSVWFATMPATAHDGVSAEIVALGVNT